MITILAFISGHFIVGVFSIGTIITMWHAIYHSDKYDIESAQRIVFFSGYLCIFSTIACIQSLSNSEKGHKMYTTWILLFGGLTFYSMTAYISNNLYNELRLNCNKV